MEEAPIKFVAKKNCKDCFGRGFVTRTHPIGKKKMVKRKSLCSCATEIKEPEPDECVVPKVADNVLGRVANIIGNSMDIIKPKKAYYASNAIPSCEDLG